MKKMIYMFLTGIIISGCSVIDNSTGPEDNLQVQKTVINLRSGLQVEEQITVCKSVNGVSGGIFNFYDNPDNVKINGKLTIPENAFTGNLDICVMLDGQTTMLTFSPSYNFSNPLILDLTYKNVDLAGVNPENIDFYYINELGQFVPTEYESKSIDVQKGILKITKVKLYHFSRYSWAK